MDKKIVELRKGKGLTQTDLADLAGVSHGTVRNWEGGRLPRVDEAKRLAEIFGVSLDYLCSTNSDGGYLASREFELQTIVSEKADELLQSLDVLATDDPRYYEAVVAEIFEHARKLLLMRQFNK